MYVELGREEEVVVVLVVEVWADGGVGCANELVVVDLVCIPAAEVDENPCVVSWVIGKMVDDGVGCVPGSRSSMSNCDAINCMSSSSELPRLCTSWDNWLEKSSVDGGRCDGASGCQ